MTVLHRDVALGNRHPIHNFEYADTAAREGAVGLTSAELHMIALQLDDDSLWQLVDDSPVTWEPLGSGGGGGTPGGADTQVQYNDTGSFAGEAAFAYNDSTNTLTVPNISTTEVASAGDLNLDPADELQINGSPGSSGQVITSNGVGIPPTWQTPAVAYTNENARDAIGAALVAGSNMTITVNDGADTITLDAAGGSYSAENAQDDVGGILVDSASIDFTYSDATPSITAVAKYAGSSAILGTADTLSRSDHIHATDVLLHWVFDEGGVPALGQKQWFMVPWAAAISEWWILANATGSCQFDLWKDTYSNFPPAIGDTITAAAKPALTSAIKNHSTTLTGWTTALAANDIIVPYLESADTMTLLELIVKITRTA